ncbi:hypothetical protein DYB25_000246 [Aphanomyces astaci]|uniref:Helicase ATP-binding domain-containing protein n=1 Tax=Aphanomyces astaci TaxID=112090 RepID=A0A397B341_APHAT|nr:hypothetical protein DYB25_000246 [Aphanomyces astaci]RHZ16469.1 hypothetical protein DYB31_000322 [Aphanomyces astaci]
MSLDEGAQIRVKFVTKNAAIRVTETPFAVPIKLARAGLSQVVNHLLNTATPKPFDFLVENTFLRTTLEKYVVTNHLTDEAVLTLEYVEAHLEPEESQSQNHPDWITHDTVIKSISIYEHVIVTGSKDLTAKVWSWDATTKSLALLGVNGGHGNSVDAVAVHDQQVHHILVVARPTRIDMLDQDRGGASVTKKQKTSANGASKAKVTQQEASTILPGHTAAVLAVAVDAHQAHVLYSGSMDRSIKLWDLTTERCTQTMVGGSQDWKHFEPTKEGGSHFTGTILSAHPDNHIRLWDPRAGKAGTTLVQATFTSHKQWVSAVEWSPLNAHQFVSSGYDGAVKLWDSRSSIPLFTLAAHTGKALDVAWLPNTKPAFVSGIGHRHFENKASIPTMSSPAPEVAAADEEKPAVAPPAAPVDVFATEEISHSLDYIMAMGQGLDADKEYTATLDNLIGQAQSGSGKTATFVLGMLYRATKDTTKRVQSLCLAPTRELARQIMAVVTVMGSFCGIETFLAIPGNEVEKGQHITAQIVVGTPGRVESLVKKRTLDLTHLKVRDLFHLLSF